MVSSRDASEHASKKRQEKGAAVLFNATAPFESSFQKDNPPCAIFESLQVPLLRYDCLTSAA